MRALLRPLTLMAALGATSGALVAQEFDAEAEVRAALGKVKDVHGGLGGMGGLGVIPENDLQTIQGILGEAERLVREARRFSQEPDSPQNTAWTVAYARAGIAMAETAEAYKESRGY